jgi:hypothetical protein
MQTTPASHEPPPQHTHTHPHNNNHHNRDYEAKSALDSYESAGINDADVTEGVGGYEEALAARRAAEAALDAADARQRGGRGRKRALPGALEGEAAGGLGVCVCGALACAGRSRHHGRAVGAAPCAGSRCPVTQ